MTKYSKADAYDERDILAKLIVFNSLSRENGINVCFFTL